MKLFDILRAQFYGFGFGVLITSFLFFGFDWLLLVGFASLAGAFYFDERDRQRGNA